MKKQKKHIIHHIKEHLFVKSSMLTVSIIFFLCLILAVLIVRYNRLSDQLTDLKKEPSRVMASEISPAPEKVFIKVGGSDEIKILREQISELESLKDLINNSK